MMARRRGTAGGEDPFVEATLRVWDWVQANARTVIAAAVVLALAVGGILYWVGYQESVREQAAAELQDLQGRLLQGQASPDAMQAQLRTFIDRYAGTESADEARLLLARLYLRTDRPAEAVALLQEVEERSPGTPIGYGAHSLLAKAHEAAGDHEGALTVLADLAEGARYEFQRVRARADRARLLVQAGRLREAAELYGTLAREAPTESDRSLYAVRLGEVRARIAAGDTAAAAGTRAGPATDTAATEAMDVSGVGGDTAGPGG